MNLINSSQIDQGIWRISWEQISIAMLESCQNDLVIHWDHMGKIIEILKEEGYYIYIKLTT